MLIDVKELMNKKKRDLFVQIEYNKKPLHALGEDVCFTEPVKITGKVRRDNDSLIFEGEAICKLRLKCSKCLTNFSYELNLDVEEEFQKNVDEKNLDVFGIKDNNIDLDQVLNYNIISSLPIRFVCSEECKGLCPMCGTNLNISTCNCSCNDEEENIDPRLAKLQNLLNDK